MTDRSITAFAVRNASATEFAVILKQLNACNEMRRFFSKCDAKQALEKASVENIDWLISNADGQFGLPTLADYEAKRAPLYADYEAKRAPLYADYKAKRDALDADHEAKRAPLDADYEAKRDALYADYEASIKALFIFVNETD